MKLSKGIKRFLVLWFSFHFIALFVNLAGINYHTSKTIKEISHSVDYSTVWGCSEMKYFYPLTSSNLKEFISNTSDFWPFINFNTYRSKDLGKDFVLCIHTFNGVFYKYDFTEFLFYSILPFLIIYLRKLWS